MTQILLLNLINITQRNDNEYSINAHAIYKHIAKAPRANAQIKALSKSLQSQRTDRKTMQQK